MMKVRLTKDWSFYKAGDVADVFEPTAENWIHNGIAEAIVDSRSIPVDATVDTHQSSAEKAVRKPARKP